MTFTAAPTSDLKRELGLFDAVMINAGTMIASAIFIVPATVAAAVHGTALMTLVWVVGGIVSLLGALSIAELAAAYPEAGGQYAYLREAYGTVWAFLYGWANFAVINTASIAAIAAGFARYIGFLFRSPPTEIAIGGIAIASILALTVLNCRGTRRGRSTAGRYWCTVRCCGDSDLRARRKQRHYSHRRANSVCDGAGWDVLPPARRRASTVRHARGCARYPGRHCLVSHRLWYLRPAIHVCRVRPIRVLCAVCKRGHPAAVQGSAAGPAIPHVGLSGHPDRVHRIRGLAGVQHDRGNAERFRDRRRNYSARAAWVLLLAARGCPPPVVDQLRQ